MDTVVDGKHFGPCNNLELALMPSPLMVKDKGKMIYRFGLSLLVTPTEFHIENASLLWLVTCIAALTGFLRLS